MIDTSKKYWTGDCAADIDEWLRLYVPNEALDIKPVVCRACGGGGFLLWLDRDEGVIQVECNARLRLRKCPVCKSCREYNLRVGFARRENGSVKWVYIGNRCTGCGTLGSWLDWKVSYEPTDEMERNT